MELPKPQLCQITVAQLRNPSPTRPGTGAGPQAPGSPPGLRLTGAGGILRPASSLGDGEVPLRAAPTYPASSCPAPPPPAARPSACARHHGGTARASAHTPPAAVWDRQPLPWPCLKHKGSGEGWQAPGEAPGPPPASERGARAGQASALRARQAQGRSWGAEGP